jgi:hypothetical protein
MWIENIRVPARNQVNIEITNWKQYIQERKKDRNHCLINDLTVHMQPCSSAQDDLLIRLDGFQDKMCLDGRLSRERMKAELKREIWKCMRSHIQRKRCEITTQRLKGDERKERTDLPKKSIRKNRLGRNGNSSRKLKPENEASVKAWPVASSSVCTLFFYFAYTVFSSVRCDLVGNDWTQLIQLNFTCQQDIRSSSSGPCAIFRIDRLWRSQSLVSTPKKVS